MTSFICILNLLKVVPTGLPIGKLISRQHDLHVQRPLTVFFEYHILLHEFIEILN